MQVRLQSFPPLGEVTVVGTRSPLPITVVLDLPQSAVLKQWEVELWASLDEGTWAPHRASLTNQTSSPFSFVNPSEDSDGFNLYFIAVLDFTSIARFTVRFRPHSQGDWAWANEVCDLGDALITVSTAAYAPGDASQKLETGDGPLLPGLDTAWTVKDRTSQSPGTRLWALDATVPAAEGPDYALRNLDLGHPWGHFIRHFALTRSGAWLNPEHGKDTYNGQWDAVVSAFLRKDGSHLVIFAVSGKGDVRSCLSVRNGTLQARIESSSEKEQTATVLVAVGQTFDNTLAAVVYEARDIMTALSSQDSVTSAVTSGDAVTTWREDWTDGLGYCTWNSLGNELTASSLLQALEDLGENGIHFTNLIIDDGWQSIDGDGWTRFEAAEEKFPDGLKATVSSIKHKYPSIDHIAIWHSIIGYWGGIAPHGEIASCYKTAIAQGHMLLLHKDSVASLYNDFYRFLASAGVDAAKADNQSALSRLESAVERRNFIYPHLDAWSGSALRHFSYRTISCMSQFEEALCRIQLPSNKPAMVARNSEDFFPDADTRTHAWHVWANAHNSLFTRYLNVLPDWDMFQTDHEWGHYHAAARCVSGGPVYITDVPGRHNMALIRQVTAVTPNTRTVVLRPSSIARSIHHFTLFDDTQVLKIGNYHNSYGGGSPMLGVFNTTDRPVTELISLASFPSVRSALEYVVRSHATGKICPPASTDREQQDPIFRISLRRTGYDILTAIPLISLQGRSEQVRVGSLGLIDKMTGCGALLGSQASLLNNGRVVVDTSLKALGIFGLWISTLPQLSVEDDFMITILGQPIPQSTVSKSKESECCLEIDIETAWKEMGLVSQWSNEVGVKVYFRT